MKNISEVLEGVKTIGIGARKRRFCCVALPKGDAQSAETFRVVGTNATDG